MTKIKASPLPRRCCALKNNTCHPLNARITYGKRQKQQKEKKEMNIAYDNEEMQALG